MNRAKWMIVVTLMSMTTPMRADERLAFFESRIRPVLVNSCYECHASSLDEPEGKLLLDSRDGLAAGGESGPAIQPGDPESSLLIKALRHESIEMPPTEKLSAQAIADFEKWIRDGAVDPRDHPPSLAVSASSAWKSELASRSGWWSLQRPIDRAIPATNSDWPTEPLDHFILAALQTEGLTPSKPASPLVLLRRLAFVLTGLPPAPNLVREFPSAHRQNPQRALEDLIDQLLSSPHFGERIARHWMDVVRYTDTYGYEWDVPAKGSWEYRDYLVRAFNHDVGYDQLIREQIAGDLLEEPRVNTEEGLNESMIGPMFFHFGEHRHGSSLAFTGIHQEMIDNKIDAFSKTFLAMTVACARCHDHKLDAISQRDYYALAGVLMTPRWTARPIDTADKYSEQIESLKKLRAEIRKQLGALWTTDRGPLASASGLRQWAIENQPLLATARQDDIPWPLKQLSSRADWVEPTDVIAKSASESTTFQLLADRSVLASGPVPDKDSYTVTLRTPPGRFNMLQLEAMTHESLGTGGPGRTKHGNFVLTEISVSVCSDSDSRSDQKNAWRDIELSSAMADYSQPSYPIASALKSVGGRGWGVGLGGNVDRTAKFVFAKPVDLPEGTDWKVRLDFDLGSQHTLGRFRLSFGSSRHATDLLAGGPQDDAQATATWTDLAKQWRETHAAREKTNRVFSQLNDFSNSGFPNGWVLDGAGLRHGHVAAGVPRIGLEGDRLIDEFLAAGYHTHSLSPKLPGAVRVPDPNKLPGGRIAIQLRGGQWAGHRSIPQNAFLNEGPKFFDPKQSGQWTVIAASPSYGGGVTRVLTEISTADLNSNFPPRTGVANSGGVRLSDEDDGFDKSSWFSVTGLVRCDGAGTPTETLAEFTSLYDTTAPTSELECWQRMRDWLTAALGRWRLGQTEPNDVKLLNWMLDSGILPNDRSTGPKVAALVERYRGIEATIGYPRSANSMDERSVLPVNYRLNIRGDVHREGDPVGRGFLEVFDGQHNVGSTDTSGRLEMARYLADPRNPLAARVFVNRVWQWVFGTGIVATPSDFGKLGARPSHPELLDWLTLRFIEDGWSTKKLIRQLVLSQTFRQSGLATGPARDRDPGNRLLHHYRTRRLEAEAIRDSLLAVSGSLDSQLTGRPIRPPRHAEDRAKRLFSGPADGRGRRSLYIEMSIMEPPKFLVGFNLPDLKLPTGRRDETNVPAQALIMLNDPFVLQLADRWAEQLVADGSAEITRRIERMFVKALGRSPTAPEQARWEAAVRSFAQSGDVMSDQAAWAELAHAIYNTSEFIYYR